MVCILEKQKFDAVFAHFSYCSSSILRSEAIYQWSFDLAVYSLVWILQCLLIIW